MVPGSNCICGERGRGQLAGLTGHGTLHKLWASIVRAFLQPPPPPPPPSPASSGSLWQALRPQLSFHFRLRPRRRRLSNSNELGGRRNREKVPGGGTGRRYQEKAGKRTYIIWSAQEVCLLWSPLGDDCLWWKEEQESGGRSRTGARWVPVSHMNQFDFELPKWFPALLSAPS